MLGRGIDQILPHPGDPRIFEPDAASAEIYRELAENAHGSISSPAPFAYVWGDLIGDLQAAKVDARIINLETSITTSSKPVPKGINYKMNPANIGALTALPVDCCALANNHLMDWGRAGLLETLATLEGVGIAYAGAGRNAEEAAAPATIERSNRGRVLVLAFASLSSGVPRDWAARDDQPGIAVLENLSSATLARIAERVRQAKQPGDLAIASIHLGGNWGYDVPREQRRFAHALIGEAGIDIVHGHSSHHPKGIEVYRGKLVLYGCGDLVNDYEGVGGYAAFRSDLVLGYLVQCTPRGQLVRLQLLPFQIKRFRLNHAPAEAINWLCGMLNRESGEFVSRVTFVVGEGKLDARWR